MDAINQFAKRIVLSDMSELIGHISTLSRTLSIFDTARGVINLMTVGEGVVAKDCRGVSRGRVALCKARLAKDGASVAYPIEVLFGANEAPGYEQSIAAESAVVDIIVTVAC